MTTGRLLDLMEAELNLGECEIGVMYSSRSYLNSKGVRVLLIDAVIPEDVDRIAEWVRSSGLSVEVIVATPFGAVRRRRVVVTGFTQ